MNIQRNLIWELILYEFELDKNNQKHLLCERWRRREATRWLKKFRSSYKNFDDQTSSDKSMDYETLFQAIEANPVSSIQRVSGELCIS